MQMKLIFLYFSFVCPPGSARPNDPANSCPPGTLSNRTDLTDRSQCQLCPARYACLRGASLPSELMHFIIAMIQFFLSALYLYSDSTAHSPTQALVASRDLHSPALLVITARLAPCSPPNTSVQQAPGMIAVGWSLRASAGHAHEAGIVWLV